MLGFLLAIVGLAGVPADLATWLKWLAPLSGNPGRWLLVLLGLALFLWAFDVPQRLLGRIRSPRVVSETVEFVFVPDTVPFVQETPIGPGTGQGMERLFRVGIKNLTDITIDGLRLLAMQLFPQGIPFAPIPLQEMNDPTGEESRRGLSLTPHATRYFNVVQKLTTSPFDVIQNQEIQIGYAVPNRPRSIPPRRYVLTLQAEGIGLRPVSRKFQIDIDGRLMLLFSPML